MVAPVKGAAAETEERVEPVMVAVGVGLVSLQSTRMPLILVHLLRAFCSTYCTLHTNQKPKQRIPRLPRKMLHRR